MKAKPDILNAFLKPNLFKTITFTLFQMLYPIKDREDIKKFKRVSIDTKLSKRSTITR